MGVGIFGGTFDPVHTGHLRVAEEVKEHFLLHRIYFVPVNIPPHKQHQPITSATDRYTMLTKAIRGNRSFRVSDIEIRRGGLSYTIDTVTEFEKKYGALYFIIGIDAFSEIATWKRYAELFFHTNFVVMVRPTNNTVSFINTIPHEVRQNVTIRDNITFEHISKKMIYFYRVTQLDISSSKIRELARQQHSFRYLVPPAVEKFILTRGLYRT